MSTPRSQVDDLLIGIRCTCSNAFSRDVLTDRITYSLVIDYLSLCSFQGLVVLSWCLWRGGTTPIHPELGGETPLRRR